MEKINKIQVNGVTYEIGGNAQDAYIVPLEYSKLANGDVADIITAFGDQENFNKFVSAAQEGKNIYIQSSNGGLAPAFCKVTGMAIVLSWYDFTSSLDTPIKIYTSITLLSGNPIIFTRSEDALHTDKRVAVDIYDLNEDSTSEKIKEALGGGDDFKGIGGFGAEVYGAKQKRDNGYNGIYAICDLGVLCTKEGEDSIYKLSCYLPGCFGKEKGGIISIRYSSGIYSVDSILAF